MTYGQRWNIGLAFQNSWDSVASTDSLHFIPMLEESIGINIPELMDENMRGIFEEGDNYGGARTVDGDINARAQAIPLGAMLSAIMERTAVSSASGLTTHTFKPRVSDWDEFSAQQPVTIYKNFQTGSAQQFYNMNGNTLEISIAHSELMSARIGFLGGNYEQIAAVAATYPTGKKFGWDVTSVQFGGASIDYIRNLTITMEENLEAVHTMNNSKYPWAVKRTDFRTITLGGTIRFKDQDEYQQFLAQSEREMEINFMNVNSEVVNIILPTGLWNEFKPIAGGPGAVEVSVTGKAKYSVGSAVSMQITLVNTLGAYL